MELIEEYRRAALFMEAGDPVEAARILEPIATAEPGNSDVRLQLALAYFGAAQLSKAEAQLRILVERDPSDHYTHHVLGRTLERQNRAAEALTHLRIANAMAVRPEYQEAVDRVARRA
ncbi:hypothetical protein Val02_36160 [Virgisporangium aliadipatigenens]|uniref:Tetratricopeptide repeat protein n=1 Tax=Virgisporangium aliadipatigenens TaxID=741659 RepID=A0A8J3YMN8_9ACTN|nr:tetratricopeptide repeat protein [Virgisporangium aliadipatigenens]GIJ46730.1 hypothetical protein Val02_36160 [Virgisporangium aliadipatigenens]